MYEIKLKEKLRDREFLVLVEEDSSVAVEFDTWNVCPQDIYEKYSKDKRFEFKEINKPLNMDIAFPQNRQVRDNVAMAQYKRMVKVEAE